MAQRSPLHRPKASNVNSKPSGKTAPRPDLQAHHGFDFNSSPHSTRPWDMAVSSSGRPSVSTFNSSEDSAGNMAKSHGKDVSSSFTSPSGSTALPSSSGPLKASSIISKSLGKTSSAFDPNVVHCPTFKSAADRALHYGNAVSYFGRPSISPFAFSHNSARDPAKHDGKISIPFDPPESLAFIRRPGAKPSRIESSVTDSPLFKLPSELRNIIYRYALNEQAAIDITKDYGIPEPALLSACKIIRCETRLIFYGENDFVCRIHGYHPAPLLLVRKKMDAENLSYGKMRKLSRGLAHLSLDTVRGKGCWKNMVTWLHAIREGKCLGLWREAHQGVLDVESHLIVTLFETAGSPIVSKEMLNVLINSIRPAFVKISADWAKD